MSGYVYDFSEVIEDFTGDHRFLSNFYPSPITAWTGWPGVGGGLDKDFEEIMYPTVEHLFQASKTSTREEHHHVLAAPTPGEAKRRGRGIQLRDDWETIKVAVMRTALALKFPVDATNELTLLLLGTGYRVLIEGNRWDDRTWGMAYDHTMFHTRSGANALGVLLMERRGVLRRLIDPTHG